jgi:hypothetical protein
MTKKLIKRSVLKLEPIKFAYGYPVYWSNNVPSDYKWAADYLK